jgi:hypothetical protein
MSPEGRIQAFLGIYDEYVVDGKVCPHAALALDGPLLPSSIQDAYRNLRQAQVVWIAQVIAEGIASGAFRGDLKAGAQAERLIQQMVGAQLGFRVTGDRGRYEEMKEDIVRSLKKFH